MEPRLYRAIKQSLSYNNDNSFDELHKFVCDLPYNLKNEMLQLIFKKRYSFKFLKEKSVSFLSWIIPLFKPEYFPNDSIVYTEGE